MDWENLPLPPNWETRFDDSSRRWFFINHSTKSTTWEDPRPAYYASEDANTPQSTNRTSRRKQKRLQCDHGFSSESPSASESPYSLPDTDDERNRLRPHSSKEADVEVTEGSESGTQDFMSYLNALRASYPDLKERQLGQLLEDFLGDSPELRKFISVHLRRNSSERSSEQQSKKGSQSTSGRTRRASYGVDRAKSPTNTTTAQSKQFRTSGVSTSADSVLKDRVSTGTMSPCSEQEEIAVAENAASRKHLSPPGLLESASGHLSTNTLKPSEPEPQQPSSCVDSTETRQSTDLTHATEVGELLSSLSTNQRAVRRTTPRGPDPSNRVPRVKPSRHNPELVKGPNRSLVSGSLSARLRDRDRC
ncbi:hypothetical protein T265_07489 [Opisthorchis viverrini]|uniref:WW domain-containing protein n=1 Tax=Opisthorchis viverrini TaxID=6198 RepID=A0A075ABF8_OPIVI|nr:hypothetical protein T265_07489 [Opisthorchis viverrini]KER24984.1 hypothetical protein T265_07489 [Opisthorchis viverrini]